MRDCSDVAKTTANFASKLHRRPFMLAGVGRPPVPVEVHHGGIYLQYVMVLADVRACRLGQAQAQAIIVP